LYFCFTKNGQIFLIKFNLTKTRITYFIAFLSIILFGILSRKTPFIPLWIGDFLYAVMIYLLVRIFFVNKKTTVIAVLSLLICYSIESLQLYQGEWIIALRKTLFGKYVLGQGFLWTDILAYTFGITFIFYSKKSF
jgi:hypothetical protein